MRVMSVPVAPFGGARLGNEELVGFGFFFVCARTKQCTSKYRSGRYLFDIVPQRGENELMGCVYNGFFDANLQI